MLVRDRSSTDIVYPNLFQIYPKLSKTVENVTCIERGNLADRYLKELAVIVYEAFEVKIAALGIPREAAIEIIRNSVVPESAFFAYQADSLVGVLGVETRSSGFLKFRLKEFRKHFHLLKALIYYLILSFDNEISRNELKIESLAVSKETRGQGIGTKLLSQVEQFATEKGYSLLSLNVVNTNTAKKLYERLGFEIIETKQLGFLTKRAGFTSVHYMQKRIQ
jgi:ribosomal protein S18 acetylase RimI-like enzyme